MKRSEFFDPYGGREGVFQFTMEHLEKQLVFRVEEDYVYGVNTLALATLEFPVKLLCYSLMSNHLHLLLRGRYTYCLRFYDWIIGRIRSYLGRKYRISGVISGMNVDISAVDSGRMFRNEVLYQIRNPYKARICSPLSYTWSSADVYFNSQCHLVCGTPFANHREVRMLLHTHMHIPNHWTHDNGRILNKWFVDYKYVEKSIGSSLEFFDGLRIYDLESVVAQAHGLEVTISFSDSEMLEKIAVICHNEYHVRSHHQLDQKSLMILARTIARRFSCPKNQIARLLGLDMSFLDKLL
jgi:hypothetical protein